MTGQYGELQQRRQQAPQQQQWMQGQSQSQRQGGIPHPNAPAPRDSADPGADGQSIYDVQDEEARGEGERKPPPWKQPPDSNAM